MKKNLLATIILTFLITAISHAQYNAFYYYKNYQTKTLYISGLLPTGATAIASSYTEGLKRLEPNCCNQKDVFLPDGLIKIHSSLYNVFIENTTQLAEAREKVINENNKNGYRIAKIASLTPVAVESKPGKVTSE